MRKVILSLVLLFVILNTWQFPSGVYLAAFDWKYCTSEIVCLHEDAHQYDYKNGHPSQSVEFRIAMDEIPAIFEWPIGRGEKYSEAYAWFWAIFKGHVPFIYAKFYPQGETK